MIKKKAQMTERGSSKRSLDAATEKKVSASSSVSSNTRIKRGRTTESVTFNAARAIRQSTKEKTVDSDVARRKAFKIKIKSRPPLKHQFSQKELLLDALETEVIFFPSNISSMISISRKLINVIFYCSADDYTDRF